MTPPPNTSPPGQQAQASRTALKLLMQAKIACDNCIHDLDTLNGVTDDWPENDSELSNSALDIHLHSEAAAKECHSIIETLNTFATAPSGTTFAQQFVEMECRQELALDEANAISALLTQVDQAYIDKDVFTDLGTVEMGKRCDRIISKLESLKEKIGQLQQLAAMAVA